QEGERERDGGRREKRAPAAGGGEHQRKQHAELRLVGEEPEAAAGERRMPLEQTERAADQRGGEEAVLPGGDVPDRAGKAERKQPAGALAKNAADRRRVGGAGRGEPGETGRHERQRRGERRREQEGRRIVPAVFAVEGVADRGLLHLPVDI